jgi:2-keto-4-pentenoate hydratase/2-oxohepta-3-ene-1,7-dioic acid hydratase in catechol pathway
MRLVTFKKPNTIGTHIGALREDGAVLDLAKVDPALEGGNMPAFISGGAAALEHAKKAALTAPVAEGATLCPPIPRPPKNVFCVGKNYYEHAAEFAGSGFDASSKEVVPEAPVVFSKPATSIIAPGEPILSYLDTSGSTDYEGELAVVIGKGGRGISKADALAHVFGYTIVNDVTARTLQHKHRQWVLGKGIDSFCPMGPAILTADEVPDPTKLRLTTHVNGEKRQDVLVAALIFDIPTLIECISSYITLEPGDVIATGTPVGVGIGFKPPVFLKPGDVVRVEVAGIGVLENPVA